MHMVYDFVKMQGNGNDFVILDSRVQSIDLTPSQVCKISDRNCGIGCDQLIILHQPTSDQADVRMAIYNADGSKVEACGNATRCIGRLWNVEYGKKQLVVETVAGLLDVQVLDGGLVSAGVGKAEVIATEPITVNIGNPHVIFLEQDLKEVELTDLSKGREDINVGIAQITDRSTILLKVWERGVGYTKSCGTGACAAVVAALLHNMVESSCKVVQEGGTITVEVFSDQQVRMIGDATLVFRGSFNDSLLVANEE